MKWLIIIVIVVIVAVLIQRAMRRNVGDGPESSSHRLDDAATPSETSTSADPPSTAGLRPDPDTTSNSFFAGEDASDPTPPPGSDFAREPEISGDQPPGTDPDRPAGEGRPTS